MENNYCTVYTVVIDLCNIQFSNFNEIYLYLHWLNIVYQFTLHYTN